MCLGFTNSLFASVDAETSAVTGLGMQNFVIDLAEASFLRELSSFGATF